ncbi:GNAT family N-acetyltransferase [Kinneretia aquatilis]|uniref:GNAT family N-acetyltransferase n=1 Tax=Kinneretia aquatilis TaxID=2070761 RepID=UPI0014950D6B|nr:GNAT family N-acetyltransferase [Paucibacter aquatile]WIV95929.1 GNAT family N-acetyltransferase [Paucibacter aquatile]
MSGSWSCHPLRHALGDFSVEWDELNRQSFRAHPMLWSGFVNQLLKHFGNGSELLCIRRQDGKADAMLVLRRRDFGTWATFLPSQAQIAPALLPDLAAAQDLLAHLPAPAWALDLMCIDTGFTQTGGLEANPRAASRSLEHARTIAIPMTGSFESYWASRHKKLISNMRRYERRTQEEGLQPDFRVVDQAQDIDAAVLRYAELESRGWKGSTGTALSADNQQGHFYREIMREFAQLGKALVFEMWFGADLVASRLVILRNESVVFLKTTYAEAYARLAPGRILLMFVIRNLHQRYPGRRIEFYTNADQDLLSWGSESRLILHFSLYRHALIARTFSAARQIRRCFTPSLLDPSLPQAEASLEFYKRPTDFPDDVKALMAQSERQSAQFSSDWYQVLLDTVMTAEDAPGFYVLRRQAKALIVLPVRMEMDLAPRHGRLVALGNYYTALYAPVLAPEAQVTDITQLFRMILAERPEIYAMYFAPLDRDSDAYRMLGEGMRQAGLKTHPYFCFGNWFQTITISGDAFVDQLSTSLRGTVRRMRKKLLQEQGRLEVITDPADLERGLEAFASVYARSWKKPEPYPDFIPNLMRRCAQRGWLRLGLAWHGDTPIAAQLWLSSHGRADIYKVAYDEEYKRFAPGSVLTAEVMRHVIDIDQVKEVDYLIGDDPYKKRWLSQRRERWGWVAYNPKTWPGLKLHVRDRLATWLRPWLARLQQAWQRLRKAPEDAATQTANLHDNA